MLAGTPVVVVIWQADDVCNDWMEDLWEELQDLYSDDYADGEAGVVLEKIIVATEWETDEHAVRDAGD